MGQALIRARLGKLKRDVSRALDRRDPLHFIHIGKNAGTQMNSLGGRITRDSRKYRFVIHGHEALLSDIPEGQAYFFSVRDPIARFKSGFYSRQREGKPRHYKKWTDSERIAFTDFAHANDLAEALFEEGPRGIAAWAAMRSIAHAARYQHLNFGLMGHFLTLRPPVFILRQENFAEDVARLFAILEMDVPLDLTEDPRAAHRTDYDGIPAFSPKAIANLERWYCADFEFYRACAAWIAARNG